MCMKRSSVLGVLRGKSVRLDPCLRARLEGLNRTPLVTVASCCGHGKYPETILAKDINGRVYDWNSKTLIPRRRRFYLKDSEGFYYVPEIIP